MESTMRFEDVFKIRSSAQTSIDVATDIVEQAHTT